MGQVELVKSRTIAEIAAIRETKLGNDLILDEFGDDFQEDLLAHSSSSPCNSYLQSHLRPSFLPACQSPLPVHSPPSMTSPTSSSPYPTPTVPNTRASILPSQILPSIRL